MIALSRDLTDLSGKTENVSGRGSTHAHIEFHFATSKRTLLTSFCCTNHRNDEWLLRWSGKGG